MKDNKEKLGKFELGTFETDIFPLFLNRTEP